LSHLSDSIANPIHVSYADIPGFKKSTVHGHHGELVFGQMDGMEVVCMRGRFHFYEGYDMSQVVFPIKVMRLLGCKLMVATNAAGGLNETFNVGDIVCIQDHFGGGSGLFGNNPLRGPNDGSLGPRFFAISDCYDDKLQDMVVDCAKELKLTHKVVYIWPK
jgi:purine-nucleoside phosphorylase